MWRDTEIACLARLLIRRTKLPLTKDFQPHFHRE
ncbi:Hypothetical protein, conserved [Brucella abortus str. 2308 A]|uniref:Uncharacterized protein n=2 Tax=Brucella TaxID=234 RepID=A0A0H3G3B6_BRUSU|nr:hypothetical protein BR0914 [Brucella suis 1330]ACU47901.1 hypothetical protein BMI_I913 [Brucella microti CCM 4915]AEK54240.1 hypothetical protein BPI_I954 [Brucella pinnipedialis B2/94]AEU05927.1 hypothetical protein BSVBI22_A0910 [Brucella suis VBI22]AHN46551.1 hypothetical protein BSS2_I0895 [Brucella suis bv. 1 str. S2]EEP64393.1 Hypothetical protein, conserved [Brucella abortus str. 2308 A]CDL76316.1 unnamed protein product [Brucella canis str. Oliveri]